jgi:aspartate carbamoyltransferase catalytic subunit
MTLDQMGIEVMIMRHNMSGSSHLLARNVSASVINAGDGMNEHPTQALLDLFTIYEKKKSFEGLKVAIIGDITHSRVARSNVFGLTKLGAKVVLAGPSTLVSSAMKTLGAEVTTDIKAAVKDADIVMGLRIQLERQKGGLFPDLREYSSLFGVNKDMLKFAKEDAIVMHPGPVNRGVELSTEVIDCNQSVINVQVKNGLAVRMAVLKLLMEGRRS